MFKGCLGLVQHAIAILRTKRKRAHRALGQVICRVLGWDFGRLPVVVLKDEPLSQSLASLVMVAFDGKNDESVMIEKEVCDLDECATSCLKEDANKKVVEDLDNGVSDMEGGKEGVMDYETLWGEPRGNAGNGNDDSGNAGSFCGNESELTLKENSDFHQWQYDKSLNEVDIGTEAYNILGENSGVDDVQGGLSR
ncbi:hypothetical protein GH714_039603 [Hevea brasiliensis]|uniref:Uncharacterized protein n=1 Tax=Hevea brasiliensis TaxID=3981 RepID=A0A6A6KEM6_HEVBR|nr:hypothetical protein GH714_039603 [Hevea brasiliensis]